MSTLLVQVSRQAGVEMVPRPLSGRLSKLNWSELSDWWRSEIESDSAYEDVVTPLLLEVLNPEADKSYLDLGCGEGRVMRSVMSQGAVAHGLDSSIELVRGLDRVFVAQLPDIPVRDSACDGVYTVLTLEHVEDHGAFFEEAARVVVPGGVLALIMNHPTWTAPGSTPITDEDGEVLWRPGGYFGSGSSEYPTPDGDIIFFHRSMGDLLNAASAVGWILERMVELPHHELEDQEGIPRLLACRWRHWPSRQN